MSRQETDKYMSQVLGWNINSEGKKISKEFTFKDFKGSIAFINQVAELAESEGHHPDIDLHWGRVGVTLTTHAIHGLSENDFIVAAKIDQLR